MSNSMDNYDQNQQTVQFYKIKLMEKDRQISSFQAKFKKIEIKNNRDIKELKIAEDKAKNALKEEKGKLDKATTKLHEVTEQNNILQHRMAELKQQKDKEIDSVRAQYNHLKKEVRSYQRILPTHTFLQQMGATIDQLPTYEQIFLNWKDKSQRYDELDSKHKTYKQETEQKISMQAKVEDNLKKKKNQLQKQLRDDLNKQLEFESQLATVQMEKDELYSKLSDIQEQHAAAMQKNEELMEERKLLEAKIQQFVQIHNSQLQAKDEEIKKMTEEYLQKYQEQINRITQDFQIKEQSHLQQLALFQEEEHRLHEKIQREKQKFEETYKELFNEVERMKGALDEEKEDHFKQRSLADSLKKQLEQSAEENRAYLLKLGENELKMQEYQRTIKTNQEKMSDQNEKVSESVEQANAIREKLQSRLSDLETENEMLQRQVIEKEKEIMSLNSQIEQMKNKASSMNRSSFPQWMEGDDSERKRRETEESIQLEVVETKNLESSKASEERNRKQSLLSRTSEKDKRKASRMLFSQEQVEKKLLQLEKENDKKLEKRLQNEQEMLMKKMKTVEDQKIAVEQKQSEEIKELKKRLESANFQLKKMERQIETLKESHQEDLNKNTKLYDVLKAEKEALEHNYITHVQQSKRDKQLILNFKNQNKELQKNNKQLQRNLQYQQTQLQQLKKYKQKQQAKQQKEKSVTSESSSTNVKDLIEKYSQQINKLTEEKDQQAAAIMKREEEIEELNKQLFAKMKKYSTIQSELEEKTRENDMLQDLLDHERKDRTLRTVPSLASLPDQDGQEEENFKEFYNQAGQKEGQIALLEREVENLNQQLEDLKESQERKLSDMQTEMTEYIQEIIRMKMIVAEAEMKASEKVHLYNQLKKKVGIK